MENHFYGHQKALVKNNIVIAVLSFSDHIHDNHVVYSGEYDEVVDLCPIDKDAFIGDAWDGSGFRSKPYKSWVLDENIVWKAPTEKPGKGFIWDEESTSWVAGDDSADNL